MEGSGIRLVKVFSSQGGVVGGYIYRDTAVAQGIEIMYPTYDMRTNVVTWHRIDKARYGKEFVEVTDDSNILINFNQGVADKAKAGSSEVVADEEGNVINPADSNKDGIVTPKEQKQYDKQHKE